MTDQRLRDLERDAAHGDLQAQARLLLERVRVGDLTEDRLELAAYLSHEAAHHALGEPAERVAAATWRSSLRDAPRPLRVRLATALARLTLESSPRQDRDVLVLLRAIDSWVACPCHDHAVVSAEAARALPWEQVVKGRRKNASHKAAIVAYNALIGMHDGNGSVRCAEPWPFSDNCWEDLLALVEQAGVAPGLVPEDTRRVTVEWLLAPRGSSA